MQKKRPSNVLRKLPVSRLYRDDIKEILAALEEASVKGLQVETAEYILDNPTEIDNLEGVFASLYIRGKDPFVMIDIISRGLFSSSITMYENSIRAEGLCSKIEAIFERRRIRMSVFRKNRYFFVGVLGLGAIAALLANHDLPTGEPATRVVYLAAASVSAFLMAILVLHLVSGLAVFRSAVDFSAKRQSFWSKNKDKILIDAGVGGLLVFAGYLLGKI